MESCNRAKGSSLRPILRRLAQRIPGVLFQAFAARKFKADSKGADDIEKAVDLAFSFRCLGIRITPYQDRAEVAEFARIAKIAQPKVVLEIGPGNGGTLFVLARASSAEATLISLDLPARALDMGHPRWMDRIFRLFPRGDQEIHILRGNSHDLATAESLGRVLAGRSIDLLFIDGDHSYKGVKTDFDMYSRFVRKGGMIAFHDILPNKSDPDFGVSDFWKEVNGRFKSLEIIEPRSAGGVLGGIGIIYV